MFAAVKNSKPRAGKDYVAEAALTLDLGLTREIGLTPFQAEDRAHPNLGSERHVTHRKQGDMRKVKVSKVRPEGRLERRDRSDHERCKVAAKKFRLHLMKQRQTKQNNKLNLTKTEVTGDSSTSKGGCVTTKDGTNDKELVKGCHLPYRRVNDVALYSWIEMSGLVLGAPGLLSMQVKAYLPSIIIWKLPCSQASLCQCTQRLTVSHYNWLERPRNLKTCHD